MKKKKKRVQLPTEMPDILIVYLKLFDQIRVNNVPGQSRFSKKKTKVNVSDFFQTVIVKRKSSRL